MIRQSFFAVCAPGLEAIAAAELRSLGFMPVRPVPGGVEISGGLIHLYRANLWSRVASRVLARLGEFSAVAFDELRRKAGGLPWETYLRPGQPLRINATARKSKLHHTGAIAERVALAVADRLGTPSPFTFNKSLEDAGDQALIVVRFDHDGCQISVDSSGEDLHRRGYRLAAAKAPLRETLAAGILLACGWDPAAPLLDPFCGSGTIPIEAALMARRIPPGLHRRFAFMDWPGFDSAAWEAMRDHASSGSRPSAPSPIVASDRDAGAIAAAVENAARAGVSGDIQFSCRAVSAVQAPAADGWLITNPPYGVRVSEAADLRNLYARFGNVARREFAGWQVGMLVGSAGLARATGLKFGPPVPLVNGGLRVWLVQARVD